MNNEYDKTKRGMLVTNQPELLEQTGYYFTDFMGCHWECRDLDTNEILYITGDYPEDYYRVQQ